MGPLEALNTLSRNVTDDTTPPFSLNIITSHSRPASTAPKTGQGSLVNQQVIATHGYCYDPQNPTADLLDGIPEAEFLLVPGGLGPPNDERPGIAEFIKQYHAAYLKGHEDRYLFTVCTGAGLAAQAGCLDDIYATTNKVAWKYVTPYGPKTYWIADARWVDQGNIWTTSGVSAGTDGMIAWMSKIYGRDIAEKVTDGMEYNVMSDPRNDPFGKRLNVQDVPGQSGLPPPET